MTDIADIRRAASGAARTMRDFQRAVTALRARAVRAAQIEGQRTFRLMAKRHQIGVHADRRGNVVKIKPFGSAWGKRKKKLKLDPRPGIARKGILKTLASPLAFVRKPQGFDIDLTRPNLTITGRDTIGRSERNIAGKRVLADRRVVAINFKRQVTNRRSFLVNAYIGHFADEKAPGLGSLATTDLQRISSAAAVAVAEHVEAIKGLARRRLGRVAAATITVRLNRI